MEFENSSYYKGLLVQGYNTNKQSLNNILKNLTYQFYPPIILIHVVNTIFLRIGFLFVHIGTVPVTNVNLILFQNFVNFTCSTFVYFLSGFIISYSEDNLNGFIGGRHWIGDVNINKTEALIAWQAIVITGAISTSGVIGRIHIIACLISTILLSGILQPFLILWAWTSNGWMAKNIFLEKQVVFKDFYGAAIIHVVGGLSALIGCLNLGRRILRLKDIDKSSIPASSPAIVFAGYFLIFLGLQVINSNDMSSKLEHVLVNNLLGSSSCSLVVIILNFIINGRFSDHWKVTRYFQSLISGLVVVSGCPEMYSPIIAIALGSINGILFYGISEMMFRSAIEDNCNIVATHLISGILGSLFTALNSNQLMSEGNSSWVDIIWQVICLFTIISTVIIIMVPTYQQLKLCRCLRNRSELSNHLRSIQILKEIRQSSMQRIFSLEKGKTVFLKPGSTSNSITKRSTDSFLKWVPESSFKFQKDDSSFNEESNEIVTDLNINEETETENLKEIVSIKENKMKKQRNVYTIQSLTQQTENFNVKIDSFFSKNSPNSKRKSHSFQNLGAGDSFSNRHFSDKDILERKKVQENESFKKMNQDTVKTEDSSFAIHRTSKEINLANLLNSRNSINFIFGTKEHFSSDESFGKNSGSLKKKLSESEVYLVSNSNQSVPIRKTF